MIGVAGEGDLLAADGIVCPCQCYCGTALFRCAFGDYITAGERRVLVPGNLAEYGFSWAAVMAFRLVRNPWAASAGAAVCTLLLAIPIYGTLPGFAWSDVLYREQFQQFILLPLAYSFIFLAFEALLVQKLQPLALVPLVGCHERGDCHSIVCGAFEGAWR